MKITIECESFEELFNYVAKASGSMATWEATPAPEPKKTSKKKAEPAVQPLPVAQPEPVPEIMPAPTPAPVAPATPAIDRNTCAKAAATLMRTNPATREQLKAILTGYGVPSIPDIPDDKIADFAEKIRALGGTL